MPVQRYRTAAGDSNSVAGWLARITVDAGTGEIGAACNHCCFVYHQKLGVHQAAADAAVFGVVNQWNLRRFE